MKKILYILPVLALFVGINGCSDNDFATLYPDPSKTSTVSCEKLMTGVFYSALTYTKPTRDGIEYLNLTIYGMNSQTVGYVNNGYTFRIGSAPDTRWKDFYKTVAQFRMLEDTYGKLDDAGKKDNEIFVLLAEVFVYEQLQQMVDVFGDMPFSTAGTLAIAGDAVTSKPTYDKAEDIYTTMLDRLGAINTRLAALQTAGLSTIAQNYLPKQDYICNGDLVAWQRFANSLRLRVALRVASNGSLTSKAQGVLKEVIENPGANPVIESNAQNILIAADNDGFDPHLDESGSHGIRDAYEADDGRNQTAPQALLDELTGDPRLSIMFKQKGGIYRGMKYDENESQQGIDLRDKLYSVVDSATFGWNSKYPGILVTAAEVSFIKAEAFNNAWASGSAENAFKEAVTQSVEFYFYLNSLSSYRTPATVPTPAEVTTFADGLWNNTSLYADNATAIGTQKWIHFSLILQREAWAELRRTALPVLTFQDIPDARAFNLPVDRFMYPESEYLYNKANYPADASRNAVTENKRKLFWAKPAGWYQTIPQVAP
ncbi:hypothetical protein AGMMS4957_10700 [Bacteroidia bacterium]|nr:hypothetical protein AGMMS4957_10700 [Bacteroidia bacterium]